MSLIPTSWKDDHRLLADALAGDVKASKALVKRLLPQSYALAWRLLGNADDANEAVQEAFCRLWERGETVRPEASLSTYFNTVVIRLCMDRFRSQRRRNETPWDDTEEQSLDLVADIDLPEKRYMDKRAAQVLQTALFKLPSRQRLALVLWAYQDHTAVEIATVLEIKENAAHQLLHRAKRALKSSLEELS